MSSLRRVLVTHLQLVDLRLIRGREILIFNLKYFESLWCAAFFFSQTEANEYHNEGQWLLWFLSHFRNTQLTFVPTDQVSHREAFWA